MSHWLSAERLPGRVAFLGGLSPRLRAATLGSLGLAVAALVVVNAGGFSTARPVAWAFGGVWGLNAAAQADQAQALLAATAAGKQKPDPRVLQLAIAKATAAVRRDALLPQAWRALALAEPQTSQESVSRAFQRLEMASFVSRRDSATSALLFQEYVRRRQTAAAFRQLDLALRRSPEARQALLPALMPGLADREFRRFLIEAMKNRVPWRADFLKLLTLSPPADKAVSNFVEELPASIISEERVAFQQLAAGLVQTGRMGGARALSLRLLPSGAGLLDGGFERSERAPPLTWAVQSTPDYDAVQGSYGGEVTGKQALYLRTTLSNPVEVARQIIFLTPGSHRLAATAGSKAGSAAPSLALAVACVRDANSVGTEIARLSFDGLTARGRRKQDFTVPGRDCRAQWLLVMVGGGSSGREAAAWLDDVAITAG